MTFPNKLSATFLVTREHPLLLDEVGQLFHDWIRVGALDDILVDVADYRHVTRGPGVILIGHECNYQVSTGEEGSLQVTCWQKRSFSSPGCPLAQTFARAVTVCRLLEERTGQNGLFDCSRVIVGARDRLSLKGPMFSVDEFVWHVRQSLSRELFTVPNVRVLLQGAHPRVEATWVAERTLQGMAERMYHAAAPSLSNSPQPQDGVSAS